MHEGNLEETFEGEHVPSFNIFNYDKTDFKDEPGRQWVVVRRGRRITEKVIKNSKSQILVMWCCSGDGQMLASIFRNFGAGVEGSHRGQNSFWWQPSFSLQLLHHLHMHRIENQIYHVGRQSDWQDASVKCKCLRTYEGEPYLRITVREPGVGDR